MKKLLRFYCLDCDNAWMEILPTYKVCSDCEYCGISVEAEDPSENNENTK